MTWIRVDNGKTENVRNEGQPWLQASPVTCPRAASLTQCPIWGCGWTPGRQQAPDPRRSEDPGTVPWEYVLFSVAGQFALVAGGPQR